MPTRKQPRTLTDLTTTKVSEQIVIFCQLLQKKKFCVSRLAKGWIVNKHSACFTLVRNQYILPSALEQDILQKSLNLWNRMKTPNNIYTHCKKEDEGRKKTDERVSALIHLFCIRGSPWEFGLTNDKFDFIINFNQNLQKLDMKRKMSVSRLSEIMTTMRSLKVLVVHYCFQDEDWSVLGKYGANLQMLRILSNSKPAIPTSAVPISVFEKFCFSDYPENTLKNPICHSLLHLEGKFNGEARMLILSNFEKLQYFVTKGSEASCYSSLVQLSQEYQTKIFPCSLKNISIHYKMYSFTEIFLHFPCLTSLEVYCFHNLRKINSDKNNILRLKISYRDAMKYHDNFPVYVSPWPKLQKLVLDFHPAYDSTAAVTLNFSSIPSNFPNLEEFHISGLKQDPVNFFPYNPFKKLEKLSITVDGTAETTDEDFYLLKHIPISLKALEITKYIDGTPFEDEAGIVDKLLTFHFPQLEKLYISLEDLPAENVLELLENYPNLKDFGLIKNNDRREVIETQCEVRNWDLKIC